MLSKEELDERYTRVIGACKMQKNFSITDDGSLFAYYEEDVVMINIYEDCLLLEYVGDVEMRDMVLELPYVKPTEKMELTLSTKLDSFNPKRHDINHFK